MASISLPAIVDRRTDDVNLEGLTTKDLIVRSLGFGFCIFIAVVVLARVTGITAPPGSDVGSVAPSISGRTASGVEISEYDFSGKVVVVDFWATWCGPCREKIPEMIALHGEYAGQDVQFVGISGDRDSQTLADYESANGITFPTIFSGADRLLSEFEIRGFPTVVVIDRAGRVVYRQHHGDVRAAIEEALKS